LKYQPAAQNISCYLKSYQYIDSDSIQVRDFTTKALQNLTDPSDVGRAICLFNAVRDGIPYNPYKFNLDQKNYKASVVTTQDSAYCIPKAILLTACLRAANIPAAIGFADVRNHLITPKLAQLMQTDLFICHGYVQLWLGEKSYKITPAFNTELCQRFGIKPLIFDGRSDALFHEFDTQERRHMEYVNDRGVYEDVPATELLATLKEAYPQLVEFERQINAGAAGHDDKFTSTEPGTTAGVP